MESAGYGQFMALQVHSIGHATWAVHWVWRVVYLLGDLARWWPACWNIWPVLDRYVASRTAVVVGLSRIRVDDFEITNTINSAPCQNVPPYLPTKWDYDTFESSVWCSRNGITPVQDCTTSYAGRCSQYHSNGWGQDFETGSCLNAGQSSGGFSLIDFPMWCIAYK